MLFLVDSRIVMVVPRSRIHPKLELPMQSTPSWWISYMFLNDPLLSVASVPFSTTYLLAVIVSEGSSAVIFGVWPACSGSSGQLSGQQSSPEPDWNHDLDFDHMKVQHIFTGFWSSGSVSLSCQKSSFLISLIHFRTNSIFLSVYFIYANWTIPIQTKGIIL